MTILRTALLICLIACVAMSAAHAGTVMGQKSDGAVGNATGLNVGNKSTPFSLFDLSRLHMNHTYSMSFFSSGGHTQSIAMYLNQIDYQFAKPLRLSVGLAFMHQPQTWFGASASSTVNNKILPSFQLVWEPSRNFHVSLNYEQYVPGMYNASYPYYNRSPYGRYGSPFD